jgi:hypothetical protein
MAEGPVSFGKPLVILVLLGCAGAGYYAYKNWPSHYEGNGWSIDWPNKWETSPVNDPNNPGKVAANGPLKKEEDGVGVGWVTVNVHGTIHFPTFVQEKVVFTLEKVDSGFDIGNRTAMVFEYEEQERGWRYLCSAVERGDAVVISAIGCNKNVFDDNRVHFEKVVKSVRCQR